MKYLLYFKESNSKTHSIEKILHHYILCALWAEETKEELADKTISNFSIKSRKDAIDQIRWFVAMTGNSIDHISDNEIGHDLWLTRNGHGSGFFDRGYDDDVEEILSDLCDVLGEVHLEVGDGGEIHLYSSNKYKDFDIKKYKKDKELKNTMKKYNV